MRLNRTDIFPLFVIIGAGVVAVGVSGALVASKSPLFSFPMAHADPHLSLQSNER